MERPNSSKFVSKLALSLTAPRNAKSIFEPANELTADMKAVAGPQFDDNGNPISYTYIGPKEIVLRMKRNLNLVNENFPLETKESVFIDKGKPSKAPTKFRRRIWEVNPEQALAKLATKELNSRLVADSASNALHRLPLSQAKLITQESRIINKFSVAQNKWSNLTKALASKTKRPIHDSVMMKSERDFQRKVEINSYLEAIMDDRDKYGDWYFHNTLRNSKAKDGRPQTAFTNFPEKPVKVAIPSIPLKIPTLPTHKTHGTQKTQNTITSQKSIIYKPSIRPHTAFIRIPGVKYDAFPYKSFDSQFHLANKLQSAPLEEYIPTSGFEIIGENIKDKELKYLKQLPDDAKLDLFSTAREQSGVLVEDYDYTRIMKEMKVSNAKAMVQSMALLK